MLPSFKSDSADYALSDKGRKLLVREYIKAILKWLYCLILIFCKLFELFYVFGV